MIIILPVAFSIFFFIRFEFHKDILRACIDAAIIFASLTVFIAEFLSLFSAYHAFVVFGTWLLVCAASYAVFRDRIRSALRMFPSESFPILADGVTNTKNRKKGKKQILIKTLFKLENVPIATIFVFCFIALLAAILFPPVNYDSHVFHLPRVFFWMQNASVHHFPTNVDRQLFHEPFSSFVFLQILVLSHGSDLLLNLSQWFSSVGAIMLAAMITAQLGLEKKWQIVSALLVMSTPMAILQSVTTQNDLQGAFWVMASVYYALRLVNTKDEESWTGTGVLLGLALGITALVKLNAAAAVAPFSIIVILFKLRKKNIKKFLNVSVIIIVCVVLLNFGHYARGFATHDFEVESVIATSPGLRIAARPAPARNYLIVQVVKNVAYNFGSPSPGVSRWIDERVRQLSSFLGVEFNSSRIRISANYFATWSPIPCHNQGASPVQSILFWLSVISFPVFFIVMRIRKEKISLLHITYLAACIASFILLAANQRFIMSMNRYLLPSLLVSMPIVTIALMMIERLRLFVLSVPTLAVAILFAAASMGRFQPWLAEFSWIWFIAFCILTLIFLYDRRKVLKPERAIAFATVFFTVVYGIMLMSASTGWTPLRKVDDALQAIHGPTPFAKWRQSVFDMVINTPSKPDFVDITIDFIDEHDISIVGLHNSHRATYAILRRFIGKDIYVKNLHTRFHRHMEDRTILPQVMFSLRRIGNDSPFSYGGIQFVPLYFAPIQGGSLAYVFFVDEKLIGNEEIE